MWEFDFCRLEHNNGDNGKYIFKKNNSEWELNGNSKA